MGKYGDVGANTYVENPSPQSFRVVRMGIAGYQEGSSGILPAASTSRIIPQIRL